MVTHRTALVVLVVTKSYTYRSILVLAPAIGEQRGSGNEGLPNDPCQ